jgi:hypothetical protein
VCLEAVLTSRAWQRRFERDLSHYSIRQCAAEHMQIIDEFALRGRKDTMQVNGGKGFERQ